MDVVAVAVDLKFELGEWKCLSKWYWKVELECCAEQRGYAV